MNDTFELKDYEDLRITPDGKRRKWSRKDGLEMASLMISESRRHLEDFHDILLSINDLTPQGVDFCISHYIVARKVLMDLYTNLLYNERVESGVNLELRELTPEIISETNKQLHELVDKWF